MRKLLEFKRILQLPVLLLVTCSLLIGCVIDDDGKIKMEMAWIESGTFPMGSRPDELGRGDNETRHIVTLTSGFYMGRYQVTQSQYRTVMGRNPSWFDSEFVGSDTSKFPVEDVSWYDAIVFCNKLSILEEYSPAYRILGSTDPADWGDIPHDLNSALPWSSVEIVEGSDGYRLPTEAQWEYACRAGTTSRFNTGLNITTNQANYNSYFLDEDSPPGIDRARTMAVGSFMPNAWRLYDMHGNVAEWCWDRYAANAYGSGADRTDPMGPLSGIERIIRGGSWLSYGETLRSANRSYEDPWDFQNFIGFRVIRPKPNEIEESD